MTTVEHWRPVTGYEARYEVSDLGRVRTRERVIAYIDGRRRRVPQRVRRTQLDTRGYPAITLTSEDGRQRPHALHVLVAAAWIGPRPDGLEVCHNDGNKLNTRADNLRYDTRTENARDVVRHGHHRWAEATHCVHGHPFTPENTYRHNGKRHCRTCVRTRLARSKARRKASA